MKNQYIIKKLIISILLSVSSIFAGIGDYDNYKVFASDGANYNGFAKQGAVAIDGDYAVVGSYLADVNEVNNCGTAYVYFWDGSSWIEQQKLVASNLSESAYFGKSVSISGDRVVIGAIGTYTTNSLGQAYIFKRNGSVWSEEAILTASDGANRDAFGTDVSIIGDELFVSANDINSYTGAVYYFKFNGTSWVEEQIITPTSTAGWKQFGRSLVFDDSNLLVGCIDDGYSGFRMPGAVYAFAKENGIWVQKSRILPDDNTERESFGISVALNGDVAVISDVNTTPEKVYIFNKTNDTTWTQIDTLKSGAATNDLYGYDLAIDDDYILVGSQQNSNVAYETGTVFVYKNNGSSWVLEENIYPPNNETMAEFGAGVACKDGRYIFGASQINGFTSSSGAAFIYMAPALTPGVITSTTAGGLWGETTTWIGGVVPTASDNVIIDGRVEANYNSTRECKNLTVNAGKVLSCSDNGVAIVVGGDVINNGTIEDNDWMALYIDIAGSLTNNGVFTIYQIEVNGTEDQTFNNADYLHSQFNFNANVSSATTWQWYKDGIAIDDVYATGEVYYYTKQDSYENYNPYGEYYCQTNAGNSRTISIIGGSSGGSEILVENFDGSEFPPNGWTQSINNSSYTWKQGNPSENPFSLIDATNVYSAICPWVAQNQDETLKTPLLSFPDDEILLEFYAGFSTSWLSYATLKLNISTDGGVTWNQIWEANNDGAGWSWRQVSIDLSTYKSFDNVILGWQYVGNDGDLVGIDNIKITSGTVGVDENISEIPTNYSLSQNYPNPFNPSTTISYQLPKQGLVTLSIYNILGQKVATLVNETQNAGNYKINFNASNLSTGTYIYQIKSGSFVESRKMLLIK